VDSHNYSFDFWPCLNLISNMSFVGGNKVSLPLCVCVSDRGSSVCNDVCAELEMVCI
jgi:hypothetical protein